MTTASRITLLSLFGLTLLPLAAQSNLPGTALSIPADQTVSAGLDAVSHCDLPNKQIVLPAISLTADADTNNNALQEQTRAIQGSPQGAAFWLHAVAKGNLLTGQETEKQLTEQADAFAKSMPLALPAVQGLIVEANEPQTAADLYSFELLRLALAAKSSHAGLKLAFVFEPGFASRHADLVKRLATYADLMGTAYTEGWQKETASLTEQTLNKPLILKLDASASATDTAALTAELAAADASIVLLWSEPADSTAVTRVCTTASFLNRSISSKMLRMDAAALPFRLMVNGKASDEIHWFGSTQSADTVIVAHVHGTHDEPVMIELYGTTPEQFSAKWYDPATGTQFTTSAPSRTADNWGQICPACGSDYLLISIHQQNDAGASAYNAVNVKAGFNLSVEEIIARWQQYRETQKQALENYQSSSFMTLHFESTSVIPAFDVSMRLREFYNRDGKTEFAQTEFYVNGVKFSNKHEFPLPELEPEKVLSQPLELKLNERYTYKLLGTEQINGALCYIVGVEPNVQDEALYSGKIWIDATTFREVRQTLSQRGMHSNLTVNVETQNFELMPDGQGHQFNLLRSISAQQSLNAAGRDFLLQRTMQFSDYAINTPQFSSALEAEHNSNDPMYRDTDHGLRVLKKQGNERVVQEISDKRIRSLVSGAMYEGTFNFPIPFLGISIADFDYRHTGAQMSLFFAGPILDVDLSKQYKGKYRLAADLALSALPGENRIYNGQTEDTSQAVWTWEQDTGLRASWQATTHLSLTASAYLSYLYFHTSTDTSTQYVLPRSGISLLPGATLKYTDHGYTLTTDVTRGQRIAWRNFGYPASTQSSPDGYTLYDADLNKDYYFKKFTKGGWDLSYYGGDQLDRFSRYFPSFFTTPRLHGIPSGTDTFDAIAMGNVHYGFNAMDLIKFEGMYSYTRARNLDESSHFRLFDGLETNFSTNGPWGTFIQGTVSYALHGNIDRYNSRWGATIMIFKPLH